MLETRSHSTTPSTVAETLRQTVPPSVTQKRAYVPVPEESRVQLLNLIEKRQLTIKEAAKHMGIKYSAAKYIVKLFRTERRVTALTKASRKLAMMSPAEGEGPRSADGSLKIESKKKVSVRRFIARKTRLNIDDVPGMSPTRKASDCGQPTGLTSSSGSGYVSPPMAILFQGEGQAVTFDFSVYARSIVQRYGQLSQATCSY